jgi:hypothetical protein
VLPWPIWRLAEMTTLTLDSPMEDEKQKMISVKMPADVLESARILAAFRGVTMTDVMAEVLRPILAETVQQEMTKRLKPAAKPTKKEGGHSK